MASAPRLAWRRIRTSVSSQVALDVTPVIDDRTRAIHERLDNLEAILRALEAQVRELREIAATQVAVENQASELVGRMLRATRDRVERLEDLEGRREHAS